MKNLILLFLVVSPWSMTIENDKEKFVGKWIGDDKYQIGPINFDSEGYAFFEIEGQIFGGKEFVLEGEKGKMTYEINTETNPIQVDLIITKLEHGEQIMLLCIAEFIDDDNMKFAVSFEGQRPTKFDSENSIVLKREN